MHVGVILWQFRRDACTVVDKGYRTDLCSVQVVLNAKNCLFFPLFEGARHVETGDSWPKLTCRQAVCLSGF